MRCGKRNKRLGRHNRRGAAFTLVELLVVIAIIAVLISLLLPALSRAIQQSKKVQCESNLRQIGAASAAFAVDHFGYYPFASQASSSPAVPANGFTPTFLADQSAEHYVYCRMNNGVDYVAPIPVALAEYLGSPSIRMDNTGAAGAFSNTQADINGAPGVGVKNVFTCPSDLESGGPEYGYWSDGNSKFLYAYSSYVWNMDVTGWGQPGDTFYATVTGGQLFTRPNANVSQIRYSEDTMYFVDGSLASQSSNSLYSYSAFFSVGSATGSSDATLYDAIWKQHGAYGRNSIPVPFRHNYRANVLFLDGHVDGIRTIPIAYLAAPSSGIDWVTTESMLPGSSAQTDLGTAYIRKQ